MMESAAHSAAIGPAPIMTCGFVSWSFVAAALDHAQRRIDQHHRAVLLHYLIAGPHQSQSGPFSALLAFDHLAFDMDGITDEGRRPDIQFHVEESESYSLHDRLHQQAFSERIYQRTRNHPALDCGLSFQKFDIGEEHFEHSS